MSLAMVKGVGPASPIGFVPRVSPYQRWLAAVEGTAA